MEATAVRLSYSSETPGLDAQVLLAHVIRQPRTWVLAHSASPLDPAQAEDLEALVRRLEDGEPLAYVVGHREFFGLDFELTPAVLIPRPETELLVEKAIDWLEASSERRNIADIGTGCGCIAICLAVKVRSVRALGTDRSLPALRVAGRNARKLGVADRIDLLNCDLLPAHPRHLRAHQEFDLVCANLPYIPTAKLRRLRVRDREPLLALDGGADGLARIRRFLKIAPSWIAPGGCLLLEIEASEGHRALALAHETFKQAAIRLHKDPAGRDRLLAIQMPGS
jgi:release factor glutamine methyltransferase